MSFFRVRPDSNQCLSPTPAMTTAMTLWQSGIANPYTLSNGYEAMDMMPNWGIFGAPIVMLPPMRPVAMNSRKLPRGGTGVFLPWKGTSRKHTRHLPPRAQKGRLMELPSPVESHLGESTSEPTIAVEG